MKVYNKNRVLPTMGTAPSRWTRGAQDDMTEIMTTCNPRRQHTQDGRRKYNTHHHTKAALNASGTTERHPQAAMNIPSQLWRHPEWLLPKYGPEGSEAQRCRTKSLVFMSPANWKKQNQKTITAFPTHPTHWAHYKTAKDSERELINIAEVASKLREV